jgi:hypothetical protein
MKLAVIGSREITDREFIEKILEMFSPEIDEIISGGARGVDSIAEEWAKRRGIKVQVFKPNYSSYGKRAPLVRNEQIVTACDYLIAFWDGQSRGTKYTINSASLDGKLKAVYVWNGIEWQTELSLIDNVGAYIE